MIPEPSDEMISFVDVLLQLVREASAQGLSQREIRLALSIVDNMVFERSSPLPTH